MEVHCYFINGSDAQGCLVVFCSNLTHVKSKPIELILMENDSIIWSVANLAHPISFYHQVFAFDIETGGSISDLAIEGSGITNQSQAVCPVVSQGILTILYGIISYIYTSISLYHFHYHFVCDGSICSSYSSPYPCLYYCGTSQK